MKLITATTAGYKSLPKAPPKKKQKLNYLELAMRRRLAVEWEQLGPAEQAALRVQRAKAGIKCNICGAIGYYRETCPKKCTVADILFKDEPPDDDDDVSVETQEPARIGVFWSQDKLVSAEQSALQELPVESDLGRLRERMYVEQAHLRAADQPLRRYQFFVSAEDGYNRNIGELTLHQVLRYLVRVVDQDLRANKATLDSKMDLTLFHPPRQPLGEDFYPAEVGAVAEYRDYFYSLKNKPDMVHRAYNNRSHMRPASMLDVAFRGADPHSDRALFLPNPDAAQPVHSQLGWKDPTATNDSLANSDPRLEAKHADFKKNFQRQSEWVEKQAQDMQQTTDRFAHLALIIRDEIRREHERETRLLKIPFGDKKNLRQVTKELWKERIEAADRIMRTLKAYRVGSSGSCEADYLIFCLDEWIRFSSGGARSFDTENASYAKYGKAEEGADDADESTVMESLRGKKAVSHKKRNKHKETGADDITVSQQALVQTYMTADVAKLRDKESALLVKYKKEADAYRRAMSDEREAQKNHASLEQQQRDALVAKRMATISFNKMEKPSKFEVRSLASLSVSQRITDRSSAASVVLSEAVPPISKQTRLLDERSLCGSPSKGSVRHVVPDKLSSDRFYDPRAVTILPSGGKQPLQQLEVEQETVVSAMSSDSGNDRKERAIITKKSSIIQTAPVEVKRVFESVAMRDRAKMKATAAVFKRMGMGRHIRSGDFNDTTQRTPVLIPLHKVLAVDPPELEMISYAAVKDVYHQKTKYANKVTGFSREKFVPLFARTTLVEKNGVTPGGDQRYMDMADNRRYSYLLGRAMSSLEPKGTKHNDPHG